MANEKRLIDANKMCRELQEEFHGMISDEELKIYQILRRLDEQPTVDAVEVVHGYWIDSYSVDHMGRIVDYGIDCSVCDSVFKDDSREVVKRWKERFKVCPFCGAQMDGEKDNEER